ncbi:hypothetical protein GSY74_01410 [Sulfurovum sp. bin170]|uniref:hypothetical protein n=1 Tax=Sulfurovum sp. bin170 TaxID=2695268 RepID=UPI0013DEE50B|nr:hypothetical protein [Sulfurovum sp. bin170]NEW59927.1 hypothetical protein [Sulfurovum sp. bin170]
MSSHISLYASKLAELKKEFSDIQKKLRNKKKSFNENQQKVYDFVMGKREIIQVGWVLSSSCFLNSAFLH